FNFYPRGLLQGERDPVFPYQPPRPAGGFFFLRYRIPKEIRWSAGATAGGIRGAFPRGLSHPFGEWRSYFGAQNSGCKRLGKLRIHTADFSGTAEGIRDS